MVLEIVIAPNGEVAEVRVVASVHRDLDHAAAEAVRQWRYEPRNDEVEVQVEIGFSLIS